MFALCSFITSKDQCCEDNYSKMEKGTSIYWMGRPGYRGFLHSSKHILISLSAPDFQKAVWRFGNNKTNTCWFWSRSLNKPHSTHQPLMNMIRCAQESKRSLPSVRRAIFYWDNGIHTSNALQAQHTLTKLNTKTWGGKLERILVYWFPEWATFHPCCPPLGYKSNALSIAYLKVWSWA